MKIYTKSGDNGTTSLLSGKRVPKSHLRIEAYGAVDELISYCGLVRDSYKNVHYSDLILEIQDRLMTIASLLAADDISIYDKLPQIIEEDILRLEKEIDIIDNTVPALHSFILPGGSQTVSFCHITRTVCRRAERDIIKLSEEYKTDPLIIKYLNRLSDFLFMLSRLISKDLNQKDIPWEPKL